MKVDLSSTFLNGAEDLTAALAPKARPARWGRRVIAVVIVLLAVSYLALIASSLREQLRPEVSPLSDGWLRVVNRDHRFQFEVPSSPTKNVNSSMTEYHNYHQQNFAIVVRTYSIGRQLLNKSATKVLQESAQLNAAQGKVTVLGMGMIDAKTHWIESRCDLAGSPQSVRVRWIIHNTQLLELSLSGQEAEVMSADATRILNSAQWLSR